MQIITIRNKNVDVQFAESSWNRQKEKIINEKPKISNLHKIYFKVLNYKKKKRLEIKLNKKIK